MSGQNEILKNGNPSEPPKSVGVSFEEYRKKAPVILDVSRSAEERPRLFEVEGLSRYYKGRNAAFGMKRPTVHAVEDLSFSIYHGETLGLVGESGCGKSTVGRLLVGLERASKGQILYRRENGDLLNIADARKKELAPVRREIQMVFQDNAAALNPRRHIFDLLAAPLLYHGMETGATVGKRVDELLNMVGLPANARTRYPHEFSGGQRQRIGIAKALSLKPRFIVCDEPVSSLDASIQAQILNLLLNLQREHQLTYIFIGHGLPAVNYVSDRIAVMYLGRLVELGPSADIFSDPWHPYTRALIHALPVPDPELRDRQKNPLEGELPSNLFPPSGCPFHPRCPEAEPSCSRERPELLPLALPLAEKTQSSPCSRRYLACPVMARRLHGERGSCCEEGHSDS